MVFILHGAVERIPSMIALLRWGMMDCTKQKLPTKTTRDETAFFIRKVGKGKDTSIAYRRLGMAWHACIGWLALRTGIVHLVLRTIAAGAVALHKDEKPTTQRRNRGSFRAHKNRFCFSYKLIS
jgi:hypothetical protein